MFILFFLFLSISFNFAQEGTSSVSPPTIASTSILPSVPTTDSKTSVASVLPTTGSAISVVSVAVTSTIQPNATSGFNSTTASAGTTAGSVVTTLLPTNSSKITLMPVTNTTTELPTTKAVPRPPSFAVGSFFIGFAVGIIICLGVGAGIFLFRKRNPSNASVGYRPYP